jgi:invasion protein IalB
MTFERIAALATLMMIALGSGALAQTAQPTATTLPAKPEKFKDWDLFCPPPKEANAPRVCEIRTILLSDKGQKLGALVVAAIAGDARSEVIASALVPLGVDLTMGPSLEVGQGKPIALKYLRCLQRGCEAMAPLSDGQQAALRAGSTAKVAVGIGGGKTATFQFSLNGFSAAHDALKKRVAAK